MDEVCGLCGRERPEFLSELSSHQLIALSGLVQHEGWAIYLDLMRAYYNQSVLALGFCPDEMAPMLKCKAEISALKKRLDFEADLLDTLQKLGDRGSVTPDELMEGMSDA